MIKCVATFGDEKYTLTMRGHADFNPGNDIICAGASALVTSLAAWIQNSSGLVWGNAQIRLEPGDALVEARGGDPVKEAFWQTVLGLGCIELAYPENIRVDVK